MLPLREIDIMGVFIAPFAVCLPLAALVTAFVILCLCRVSHYARWPQRPLIELGLYTGVLATFVLLLGRL